MKGLWTVIFILILLAFLWPNNKQRNLSQSLSRTISDTNKAPQRFPRSRHPAATSTPTPDGVHSAEDFKKRFPGKWQFRRRSDDTIQSITGGLIENIGENSESALKFARQISPLLATGEYKLKPEPRTVASNKKMRSFHIEQEANGYSVYQGSLQLISRSSDGAVYIVNNQLRDITAFNPEPILTISEGLRIVEAKYQEATITAPEVANVFALRGQTSQLAWTFKVVQKQPKFSQKDVVVSAVDGRILYVQDYAIHD